VGERVLDEGTLLRDLPDWNGLELVELVEISVIPRGGAYTDTRRYSSLPGTRRVGEFRALVGGDFPDSDIANDLGEVLDSGMYLATVVRKCRMPLHAIPQGVVRQIKISMGQYAPKEFFVHEDTTAYQVKQILMGHVPGLHQECGLFDSNGNAIREDALVKELHGEIKVERHVKRPSDDTGPLGKSIHRDIFGTQVLGKAGHVVDALRAADPKAYRSAEAKALGPPVPGRWGAGGVVGPPRRPVAAVRAPPDEFGIDRDPLPEPLILCEQGFRADRPNRVPPAAPVRAGAPPGDARDAGRRPLDYEERLRSLEIDSGADRKTCARCFNFHGYDFDRALRDLQRR
jgi:hypothetical protein